MAGKKRERLDLIYDILQAIRKSRNEIGPTKLLFLSNLSSKMFKDYITELQEKDFIIETIEKNKKKYSLTKKGNEFIDKYKEMKQFIENFGL